MAIRNKIEELRSEENNILSFLAEINPSIEDYIDSLNLKNENQFKAFLKKAIKLIEHYGKKTKKL